jgi:acetyl-CoA/propionyl-CoA carboxylase biotin carboxyl carrier protein
MRGWGPWLRLFVSFGISAGLLALLLRAVDPSSLAAALAATEVGGVASTVPALARIVDHDDFRRAAHWTTWLEQAVDLSDLAGAVPEPDGAGPGADFTVTVDGDAWPVRLYRHRHRHRPLAPGRAGPGSGQVASPLAGTLVRLAVEPGQTVTEGAVLAVVEAMKMETPLRAPFDASVVEVKALPGEPVSAGQVIMVLGPG